MMTLTPLVSIVVPARNLSNYIVETLTSIVNQTYQNIEIIVVDDHSTDDTRKKVLSINDSRIYLIDSYGKNGPAGSRNTGIQQAKGKYLSFIDGDDQIHPYFIETLVEQLESNQLAKIATVKFAWDASISDFNQNQMKKPNVKWQKIHKQQMFAGVTTSGHLISGMVFNKLYNLEMIKESGVLFNEDLQLAEDHLWIAQLIASKNSGDIFFFSPAVMYYKVNRGGSIIHTATKEMRAIEQEVNSLISRIGDNLNKRYI
ncbi:MAG: glycosyltransferase family 2 protein [Lactobacillaceae bacterium]|jgi:glycosyltransferase involved in cell wall biosynthesis|nr:glycosyltransferase family 2 protein [Lactobacillaceae bacterium]